MKPHDEWNSADRADYARRAEYLDHLEEQSEHKRPFPLITVLLVSIGLWLAIIWLAVKLATLAGWV